MFTKRKPLVFLSIILLLAVIVSGCQAAVTPETVLETMIVTEIIEGTPVEVVKIVTPTPEPTGPRTLVICQGDEPDSLFRYGTDTFAADQILNAIYDGPIDTASFGYQPVILEKLPNLSDGDAVLSTVLVGEGDMVVDASGEVVELDANADPPIMLVPAGSTSEQAVAYQGGDVEMEQLTSTFKLLPGLTWSDGTPLTASDSVYAFNLQADPDVLSNEYTTLRTASYEAIDDLTTVWTGIPGFRDASYGINFFTPAPEHVWGQFTAADLREAEESSRRPIGWGPYIIDEWVQGDLISMHKNPNYFRAVRGCRTSRTLSSASWEVVATPISPPCWLGNATSSTRPQASGTKVSCCSSCRTVVSLMPALYRERFGNTLISVSSLRNMMMATS